MLCVEDTVLCEMQIGKLVVLSTLASRVNLPEAKKRRKHFGSAAAVAPLASVFCHHPGISGFCLTSTPKMFDVLLLVSDMFLTSVRSMVSKWWKMDHKISVLEVLLEVSLWAAWCNCHVEVNLSMPPHICLWILGQKPKGLCGGFL